MKKKNVMKGTALALISAMGVQSVNWAPLSVHAEESRTNVDSKLAYFVDCGDYDVTTLSAGDLFGQYNSVTDQAYQADEVTGKKWGIVDSVSNPLKNGTAPNAAITDAAYTDNTWPFETDAAIVDGADKKSTNRYTKNQFENGIARNLHYAFELPNGTYTVEMYFADPWGVSQTPDVEAEGSVVINGAIAGTAEQAVVEVKDGELNLDITSESLCINLSYIKIYFGDVTTPDVTPGDDDNADETIKGIAAYDLSDVDVTDAYLTNAEEKDIAYMLSLDSDRLLAGFRETAGLDMQGATRYDGWENTLIGGHTMGHYLTAMAQAVAELPDTDERKEEVAEKLEYIIDGLKECQDALGTGYIFGATLPDKSNPEAQFDNVEKGLTNIGTQSWVPWYTMHKILAGLVDTYKYTGNQTALETAEALGDWIYDRTAGWDTATRNRVLGIEYGGMNDCLYELYAVTQNDKYAVAAHVFDEDSLFKTVAAGADNALNNKHANTTIPKFLGAINRYVTTNGKVINGEEVDASVYLTYAEKFFDMVLENHTYITGDNSEWEHFGADHVLDAERTNCNCETCNAYNMLKLAKALYMVTGDKKYADYYENTFYNTILSAQNPETGMTTYFQPMASGYFKVYGTETQSFWCCTGSGMENFTKLGNAIYYRTEDKVLVNQYLSSVLTDTSKNIKITQTADIPESDTVQFVVNTLDGSESINSSVGFRLPDWLAADATITVNGVEAEYQNEAGYAVVSGLNDGDEVEITLPMEIKAYNLPDGESVYAFKYGPIVLSAELGSTDMKQTTTGVSVSIPASKLIEEEYISDGTENISVLNGSVSDFMKNINSNLVKTEGELEWTLENTDANLTFVPHYSQHTQRYGIYFNYTANSGAFNVTKYLKDKETARFENAKQDVVQPGYGQYENDEDHNMQESNSVGQTSDGTSRYAKPGGYFIYTMKTAPNEDNVLEVTFRGADEGKSIKISVDGTVVYDEVLSFSKARAAVSDTDEYTVRIPVSADMIGDKTKVDVKFESGKADEDSAAAYNFIYMTKAYSTDASLELTSSEGTVTKADDKSYTISVGKDVTSVDLTAKIASEYGYVRVNGSVVKETQPYTVDLRKNNFITLTYTVYAEDMETSEDYTVNIQKETDADSREDADKKLAYFVNCGDYDVTTLSEGDLFGVYNGVTDQAYGVDPVTGKKWGIVDTVSNPLKNGEVTNNPAMTNAVFTDNTWTFETNTSITDESDKTLTNRYTKNQWESGKDRKLSYAFEVPDGTYKVEMYFADPWGVSKDPIVSAEGNTVIEKAGTNTAVTADVTVTDGELNLDVTSPDATKCLNLSYIKVYMPETTPDDGGKDDSTGKDDTAGKDDGTGKDDTAGKDDSTGKDDTAGKDDSTGKDNDAGKNDNAGNSTTAGQIGQTAKNDTTTAKGENKTADGSTKTGDTAPVAPLAAAAAASLGIVAVSLKKKKKAE